MHSTRPRLAQVASHAHEFLVKLCDFAGPQIAQEKENKRETDVKIWPPARAVLRVLLTEVASMNESMRVLDLLVEDTSIKSIP